MTSTSTNSSLAPTQAATYPVCLDLRGRQALVVGAGSVAARKIGGLLRAGATVTVVAPEAGEEVAALAEHRAVRWFQRAYRRGEVASYVVAITATDDPAVNAQVARDGDAAKVFVNSADDPDNCTFVLPAVMTRGDLQIAVSTNGRSPAFASWIRRRLEAQFTDAYAQALDVVAEVRAEARERYGTTEVDGWATAIDDSLIEMVSAGRTDDARQHIRRVLGLAEDSAVHGAPHTKEPKEAAP